MASQKSQCRKNSDAVPRNRLSKYKLSDKIEDAMGFATAFTDAELGKATSANQCAEDPYVFVDKARCEHERKTMKALRKAMQLLEDAHRSFAAACTYAGAHVDLLPESIAAQTMHTAVHRVMYQTRHEVNKYLQASRPQPNAEVPCSAGNYI
jgi:hypothetical protein